jgi:hypothetical protein
LAGKVDARQAAGVAGVEVALGAADAVLRLVVDHREDVEAVLSRSPKP